MIREVSVDVIMKIYEHLRRLCASKKCLSFEDLITGLQFVAGKWSAACAGILIVEGGRGEILVFLTLTTMILYTTIFSLTTDGCE